MDFTLKDHHITRILSGLIRLQPNIYSTYISPRDRTYADEVYEEAYEVAENNGSFTEKELQLFLLNRNLWNDADQEYLDTLNAELEKLKINGLGKQLKTQELATVRRTITKVKTEISSLEERKYKFNFLTCGGFAQIEKAKFLLSASLRNKSNRQIIKNYWRADANFINDLMTTYVAKRLGEQEIREISRTEPWRSHWVVGKERDLFGRPVNKYTDEQKSLVLWSTFYDNIYNHPERPSDVVIDDNDFLDGWLILEKKKHKVEQTKSKLGFDEQKLGPGEVFVPVGSQQDAAELDDLNDDLAKLRKKRRIQITKERGRVNELEMPDTRAKIAMMLNEKAMRGK